MRKRFVVGSILVGSLVWGGGTAVSAPPRDGKQLKGKPAHFKPCRTMSAEQVKRLQKKGAIRAAGQRGIRAAETKKILVIRVDFAGGPAMAAGNKPLADAFFDDMRRYFHENSYGVFTVSVTVTGNVYTLLSVSLYNSETDADLARLRDHSITAAANDGVSFAPYDYIMIYHAGRGEEDSGATGDLWSLFYGGSFSVAGKAFDGFTVVPELSRTGSSPLGVICHEFGHQIGLPDLYDTTVAGGRSTCGSWSLMDYPYGFDNTGRNPPHLDSWSKHYLQFIDLAARVTPSSLPDAELGDSETSQTTGYYKIPIDVASSSEYFIVEYRMPDQAKMRYDLTLPATGLVIWHIDDAVALDASRLANNTINSGTPHLGVDLVEADGVAQFPPGKQGDAFAGGATFASPLSNAFSKTPSGITLANIALAGSRATFIIGKIAAADTMDIAKAINYPNPAGNGYPHPREGTGVLTTIVFHASRPPGDLNMNIYNLAGERIRSASKDDILLRLTPSGDFKWVYEYDWDGRNASGEAVAPGLYFYHIKADDKTKVGKLAVVR